MGMWEETSTMDHGDGLGPGDAPVVGLERGA